MTFKESATRQGVQPQIWVALGIAETIYRYNGLKMVVTSLTDSHADKPASLHNRGLAADIRTRNVPHDLLRTVHGSLTSVLDPMGFDVVLEADHLHIEYDPRQTENWIALEVSKPQTA